MWRLLLVPGLAAAFFFSIYFYFYSGSGYSAPPNPEVPVAYLTAPISSVTPFEDKPVVNRGTLLVDGLHGNFFSQAEVSSFLSMIRDRGYDVEVLGEPDPFSGLGGPYAFGKLGGTDPFSRLSLLEEKLRGADSLLVALPRREYAPGEVDLIEDFVLRKGGKLMMIGDPTRPHQANTLAGRFGVAFQSDYLFNTVEYDLNFQNIIVRDFLPHEITRGVGQIALYSTSSIKGPAPGLAVADGNTRSSLAEGPGPFYPLLTAADGRVLALGDFTSMIPPRNSVLDNNRLLANIASFLTVSEREFVLSDFPHFFEDDVDILLGRPSLLGLASGMGDTLAASRVASGIAGAEDITRDTVFLGLYEDAGQVAQYLQLAGVQLDGSLRTPFTADMDPADTGAVLLHTGPERRVLVVLADSQFALANLVSLLRSGEFRDGLVDDFVGVYRFE